MNTKAEKRSHVRLPREQRMQDIEAAAKAVFSRDGYDAAAISEIAALAGVSEGSIYKFYESKRDLLHTVLKSWYRSLIDELEAKLEGVEGISSRLHLVIWQHLNSIKSDPVCCSLFFSEVRSSTDYESTELFQMNKEYANILTNIMKTGVETGDLKESTPIYLVRDVVFGCIEHRVSAYLAGKGDLDCDVIALQLAEVINHGIFPSSEGDWGIKKVVGRLEQLANKIERAAK